MDRSSDQDAQPEPPAPQLVVTVTGTQRPWLMKLIDRYLVPFMRRRVEAMEEREKSKSGDAT